MNRRQLAERIGSIDDRLVQEAVQGPQKSGKGHGVLFRRLFTAAAVLALMLCSGAVGAFAFGRAAAAEPPAQPEMIALEEIGITLLLPDSWKGRCGVEEDEFGNYILYSTEVRAACRETWGEDAGGNLCYIRLWDEQLTEEQVDRGGEWSYTACSYLMTTGDGTYLLYHVSDVQWTGETQELYRRMESEIGELRFVLDHVSGARGTAYLG